MNTDISFLLFSAVFLFFCMAFFIVYVFLHHRGMQRANERDKEKMISAFNEELLRSQLEIQEQAFRNISQEIHDNIGQSLSIAKIYLGTLDFDDHASLRQKTSDSKEMIGKAIRDLRDISHALSPDFVADKGLVASAEHELGAIERTGRIAVHFELSGAPYPVGPQKELILFRILQQSIGNVIAHSGASEIRVAFRYESRALSISVQDNGSGFDARALSPEKGDRGIGIHNMRSRAKMIGASFSIESTPGKGTNVSVGLPIEKK